MAVTPQNGSMGRIIESVALELLRAIDAEWMEQGNLSKCKALVAIARDVCESQEEFDKVHRYLWDRRLIEGCKPSRWESGKAVRPRL